MGGGEGAIHSQNGEEKRRRKEKNKLSVASKHTHIVFPPLPVNEKRRNEKNILNGCNPIHPGRKASKQVSPPFSSSTQQHPQGDKNPDLVYILKPRLGLYWNMLLVCSK